MKKILFAFITGLIAFSGFILPVPVLAQDGPFDDVCKRAPDSSVCQQTKDNRNPLFGPTGILTSAIKILSIIVGIAALIMILLAGLKFITSGSNPQDVTTAREMLLYAVVGLFIAAFAQLIVRYFLSKIT